MRAEIINTDDQYILNHCARFLARDSTDPRHNFGQYATDDPRGQVSEAWRFPVIDSHYDENDPVGSSARNAVTFVYTSRGGPGPGAVAVVGTFGRLYEPIPLRRVDASVYFAVTVAVPKGEVHTYKYLINGAYELDPLNPQIVTLNNDVPWSRFFTQYCAQPISFEPWELELLDRLTTHILPFRTRDGEQFLDRYYNGLDNEARQVQHPSAYRLDHSVGPVNFIDKLVAREENHRLIDYKICLELIDLLLRQRNPFMEPRQMPRHMYVELYDQMASNNVNGWDYGRYGSPRFFLQLLRRHTGAGAFCHPKHGGNAGAAGWSYLESRYRDDADNTLFDWRAAIEAPLGRNVDYRG